MFLYLVVVLLFGNRFRFFLLESCEIIGGGGCILLSTIYCRFQIVSLARGQHFQVACGRYFEVTHKVCRPYVFGTSHPFFTYDMLLSF